MGQTEKVSETEPWAGRRWGDLRQGSPLRPLCQTPGRCGGREAGSVIAEELLSHCLGRIGRRGGAQVAHRARSGQPSDAW